MVYDLTMGAEAKAAVVAPLVRKRLLDAGISLGVGCICLVIALLTGRLSFMIADCLLLAILTFAGVPRLMALVQERSSETRDSMDGLLAESALRTAGRAWLLQAFYLAGLLVVVLLPLREPRAGAFGSLSGVEFGLTAISVRSLFRARGYEREKAVRIYFAATQIRFSDKSRSRFFFVQS